jgi:hypothetical protein
MVPRNIFIRKYPYSLPPHLLLLRLHRWVSGMCFWPLDKRRRWVLQAEKREKLNISEEIRQRDKGSHIHLLALYLLEINFQLEPLLLENIKN